MEKYTKISQIGKGTFGTVNLVERKSDKKLFALKKTYYLQEQNYCPYNEIKILESLDHKNIIKYHESFTYNNKFAIVTEYASKGDLSNLIKMKKILNEQISENQILDYLSQMTDALQYMFDKKVIHRDIKIQNIFLSEDSQIKIGDFGISKQLENSFDLAKTSLGTPYYLSPEICQNSKYDHKTDIWMLGCVLYELATYEKPFQGDSLNVQISLFKAIIYNIMHNDPLRITNQYSEFLKNLIMSLLEKNPEKRLNVIQLKQKLDNYKQIKKQDEFIKNKLFFENKIKFDNLNTPTTLESDVSRFKKKVQISIVTQNLNNQDKRPESDKYGIINMLEDEFSQNRPKSFSFGKQIFNGFTPTSPQRQMLFQEFLKKRLGEEKYQKIYNLIKIQKNPTDFISEENQSLIEILGEQNKDALKCFKMIFLQPQIQENKKFSFQIQKQ